MPESGPQGGGMNRRQFLTKGAAIAAAGFLAEGKAAEAQERKALDYLITDLNTSITLERIDYPKEFKEISKQVE